MLWALAGKLLLAASKLKCLLSHAPGSGTCCGCTWHSAEEEGECCNDVWYVGDYPCPEGTIYLRWGPADSCCGCLPEQIWDSRVGDFVNTVDVKNDLCCPFMPPANGQNMLPFDGNGNDIGCLQRCCTDNGCTNAHVAECEQAGGTPLAGFCEGLGCPAGCCVEDHDGNVSCEIVDGALQCVAPRVLADPDCATGCKGQCCVEDEEGIYQPQGMMTQDECAAMDGKWAGLGNVDCSQCACREPFSCDCCESATSTAAGLTFTQPRKKRHPQFANTFRVRVSGSTDSAILVHGTPVGAGCDFEVEFLLCWESFNIEPVPCGSNFKKLDVTVCWFEQETISETLNFAGCNTGLSIHLGNCEYDCVTTLVYDQDASRSSDAHIYTRNDATLLVESGTIEFTGDITAVAATQGGVACSTSPRVLHLSGGVGKITGVIGDVPGGRVEVQQRGTWWLGGQNEFSGRLSVFEGTLVVAADANGSSGTASPFGTTNGSAYRPRLGDPAGNMQPAALLLADGVTVSRSFTVETLGASASQLTTIGGYGSGSCEFTAGITIGRDVTLQSAGGTVTFSGSLLAASGVTPTLTIGSASAAGTVVASKALPAGVPVVVAYGTFRLNGPGVSGGIIDPASTVTVSATLDLNSYTQSLTDITLDSSATITGGTLGLGYSGTACAVSVSGACEIASAVSLHEPTTISTSSGSSLTSSGVVSGAASLTLDGSGSVTLSAANSYSGGTTISGCTVDIGDAAALGTGGVTVTSGGILNLNGYTVSNTITNFGGTVNP